jgi:hypothetical protein
MKCQRIIRKWSLIFVGLPLHVGYALCPTKIAHQSSACASSSWCQNQRLELFPKKHVRKDPSLSSLISEKAAAAVRKVRKCKTHTPQCVNQRKGRTRNLSRFHGTEPVIFKPVISDTNVVGLAPNLVISFLA